MERSAALCVPSKSKGEHSDHSRALDAPAPAAAVAHVEAQLKSLHEREKVFLCLHLKDHYPCPLHKPSHLLVTFSGTTTWFPKGWGNSSAAVMVTQNICRFGILIRNVSFSMCLYNRLPACETSEVSE